MFSTRVVRQKMGRDEWLQKILIAAMVVSLFISVMLPLGDLFSKVFVDSQGNYIGFTNLIRYFSTPALSLSFTNTLYISVCYDTDFRLARLFVRIRTDAIEHERESVFPVCGAPSLVFTDDDARDRPHLFVRQSGADYKRIFRIV
ncbi:UNVERIFIED_CONTAM: hypothetical protein ABID98_001230 [Brevibacillus sp. OAP136]